MLKIVAIAIGLALSALAAHQSTPVPTTSTDPIPCSPTHRCVQ